MRRTNAGLAVLMIASCFAATTSFGQTYTNIAWAKRDLDDDYFPDDTDTWYYVSGRITSQNFKTNETWMFIQDTNDNVGILVFSEAFTVDDSQYRIGMEMQVWDYVGQTNGLRYINPRFPTRVIGPPPSDTNIVAIHPLTGTISDFLADAESYEASYVVISNVYLSPDSEAWPAWNAEEAVTVTDATGKINLYIDTTTDIGGQLAPTNAFDIFGIFAQYDKDAFPNNDYEIVARSYTDIRQSSEQQPPQILVVDSNIFSIAVGADLTIDLLGQDRNPEDVLSITNTTKPTGSSIVDYGNREARFSWTPAPGYVGTTNTVVFEVTDGIASSEVTITIFVLSEELADIRLNEVQWDPASSPLGDANGDGFYSSTQDEFVEIANNNTNDMDITGWKLRYGTNVYFTFPSAVLTGRTALVVFGGGTPSGTFGESMVFTATSWGGLPSSTVGDTVNLLTDDGLQIFSVDYDDYPSADQSITRNPDYTGDYTLHTNVVPWLRFSPGTMGSGKAFLGTGITNTPPLIRPVADQVTGVGYDIQFTFTAFDPETNAITLSISNAPADSSFIDAGDGTGTLSYTGRVSDAGTTFDMSLYADDGVDFSSVDFSLVVVETKYSGLIINEYCPDPTPNVDANGDGEVDTSQDEFIEIVNVTTGELDMAGLMIYDSASLKHRFTTQLVPTGAAIVVVGGGSTTGFAYPPVQTASSGALGLNNSGDSILLYSPQTTLIARIDYENSWNGASWTLYPDITGEWTNHIEVTGLSSYASPGTKVDGYPFQTNQLPTLKPIGNKTATVSNELAFSMATIETDGDDVTIVASNKPASADFTDNGDGSADFSWTPEASETGAFSVTFHAYDKDGFDSETIDITVSGEPSETLLDIGGYEVIQSNSTYSYTLPDETVIEPQGYVVIGRDADQSSFESFWGVTLPANVTYLNSSDNMPLLNGAEIYVLKDGAGLLLDGPSGQAVSSGRTVQRNNTSDDGTLAGSWTMSDNSNADPGSGANGDGTAGLVINEYADASGTGNYIYEFIELYYDAVLGSDLPPVLLTIGNKGIYIGDTLTFSVEAADLDEDPITLFATDLPAGAEFSTVTNAAGVTNTFTWAGASPVGVYTSTFWAVDKDGTNSETILISVTTPPVDFWDFEDGWQSWTQYSRASDSDWVRVDGSGGAESSTNYMYANGFAADTASDDWLISPSIDLSSHADPELSYWTYRQYTGPDITVQASTNYSGTGDPLAAGVVWSSLSFTAPSSDSTWEQQTNSLVNYAGLSDVYIAYRYTSTGTGGSDAEWWQVDQIRIVDVGSGFVDSDLDGIDDNWEILHFTNLTASGSSSNFDGDASSDLEEYIADTDPHDAASVYDNIITNAAGFGTFNLIAGPPTTNSRMYDAFSSTSLVNDTWSPYGLNVPGAADGSAVTLTVTNTVEERFYRTGVYVP